MLAVKFRESVTVTWNEYAPSAEKVRLGVLEVVELNDTGAGPVAVQLYFKVEVPWGSVAVTERLAFFEDAVVAEIAVMVGPVAETTETLAVPLCVIVPDVALALTVAEPVPPLARYKPAVVVDIAPTPVTDQVTDALMAAPNWSLTAAVNCCEPLTATVALAGDTVTEVRV